MSKGRVSVREYATFAYDVYSSPSQQSSSDLPDGWKRFEACPEPLRWYGYFGSSYLKVNEKTKTLDLVIAHRGTDNLYGVIEDTELWLANYVPAQYQYGAKPFVNHLLATLNDKYPIDQYQWNLHATGHSLGATLAELTIADNELFKMNGLSFESPGSIELIKQMQKEDLLPENALAYVRSKDKEGNPVAISIKARPDEINTLQPTPNPPIGPVPIPNTYPRNILGVLPLDPGYLDYTRYSFWVEHSMKSMLDWLNKNDIDQLPILLKPWPIGLEAGYRWYKSYDQNRDYWDGYINELWHNNGLLSTLIKIGFHDNYDAFKHYYIDNLLYQEPKTDKQETRTKNFFDFIVERYLKRLSIDPPKKEELRIDYLSKLSNYLPNIKISKTPHPQSFLATNDTLATMTQLKKENSKNEIRNKLLATQMNFKQIKQDPARKEALTECLKIFGQSEENSANLSLGEVKQKLLRVRNKTKETHEGKYYFLAPIVGLFKQSRTVHAMDTLLEDIEHLLK